MVRSAIISLMLLAALVCTSGCPPSEPAPSPQSQSSTATAPAQAGAQPPPLPPSPSQSVAILEASKAIGAWLKLLDNGKYGEVWDQTGKLFKDTSPKDAWCKQVGAIRTALGPVVSRTSRQTDYKTQIDKGGPIGEYVTIHYDTVFQNQPNGVEEITVMREKDGSWHSLGYYVTARPLGRATH
jgi:hypothetical protein